MSHDGEASGLRGQESDWLPSRLPRLVLPSWLASVTVHALLLLVFATSLKSCATSGLTGEPDGKFREVGIFLKDTNKLVDQTEADEDADDQADQAQAAASVGLPAEAESFKVADTPPAKLNLPETADPVVGPGRGPVSPVPGDVDNMLKQSGISRPAQMPGLGQDNAEFGGIWEKGTRFVYVLDASGSMANDNAIGVAKMHLMASLQSLARTQQFQIIFYNETARAMTTRGEKQPKLYWADDRNRLLARQFISGIRADLGTRHMPAIKKALRMSPEVIFLLTDADEPRLDAGDLDEIKKLNQGGTRINCIEFGRGPDLGGDNFLKRLARQNGGKHRYQDVTQFGK